jgi:hypothetical protein
LEGDGSHGKLTILRLAILPAAKGFQEDGEMSVGTWSKSAKP